MNYEEKYKNALDRARKELQGCVHKDCDDMTRRTAITIIQNLFPELKESEYERTRKEIIDFLGMPHPQFVGKRDHEKWIAWLEKQRESDKSLYIRFGNIPINGKSKVYNGEIEIGIEEGISVYPAFEDKEGNIILGLNLPITKTSLYTQQHLLEYESRPCYLVTGDYVGKGTDGEPLIKNVRIIKEIKPYRIMQDKENNSYIINNTPNCGISVSYDINKMVNEFANTEVKGYGIPSMIEVDAYRKGIEDALEKQGKQTQLGCEHADISLKDLENLFQALPEKIVDEKSHQVYELCVYHYDDQCIVDYVGELDHDSLYTFGGDTLYDAIEKAWNWLRKNSTGE